MPTLTDEQQRTLAAPATVEGMGLFTGKSVTATFHPAKPGEGIVFRRLDIDDKPRIPARVEYASEQPRRTSLQVGEARVEMVEHCLSALSGLGVDNARIDLTGPELPAADGSAIPFVEAIQQAGLVEQDAPRHPLVITETLTVREGDALITAMPSESSAMEALYVLDYGVDSPLGRQLHDFQLSRDSYIREIAPARTFSTRADAEAMWERGLFKHLSPKDMLVIDESGPIDNTYRFDDEPVRHKVLDLLGDLYLVGRPIHGRVVAMRSGHALNRKLARALLEMERRSGTGLRSEGPAMDIGRILRLLPHRYPMILIDRVLDIEGDRRAIGIKNVSINEPFFQGHYPDAPIMPGVLIVEAMSQLAGLMLSQKLERTGKIAVLLSLDNVKLRKPVVPGDQLVIETEALRTSSRFGDVQARSYVSGNLVAEARIKFMMVDAEQTL